jgi:excisionase family DNA binding protein
MAISSKWRKVMSDYVTIKVLAQRSSLSERTLRKLIRCGEIFHYRPDPKGKILIRLSDFDAWIESRRVLIEKDIDAKEMLELLFASEPKRKSA